MVIFLFIFDIIYTNTFKETFIINTSTRQEGRNIVEEQIVTITVKTQGEVCEMSDEEIQKWYESHIAKLFNPEYGTPEIKVDVKRIEK